MRYQTRHHQPRQLTEGEIQDLQAILKRNWHKGTPEKMEQELKDFINQRIHTNNE